MMNFGDMFGMLDSVPNDYDFGNNNSNGSCTSMMPVEFPYVDGGYKPETTTGGSIIDNWTDAFNGFKTRPVLYNVDGYISPYSSNNWGGTSNLLKYIDDDSRLPAVDQKIDPNKIFTAEINSLRALSADQQRIVKLFEKRLSESLNEKGKVGLTEEDIEAMSALTAARGAITAITKEQVGIRKNIADIRLKQQQNRDAAAGGGAGNGNSSGSMKGMGAMEIGRSILDSVFDAPGIRYDMTNNGGGGITPYQQQVANNYAPADVSKAASVLDALVPSVGGNVAYESAEPTTYVVVGDTDDDIEFVTYGSDGSIIPDYPVPDARIDNIDRDAKKATDQYLVSYPVKFRGE